MNPYAATGGNINEQIIAFEEATVFTVIEITNDDIQEPEPAEVVVPQNGDVCLPTEGDTVMVGYRRNGRPLVVGTQYTDSTDIPPFEEGERVIGHPTSDSTIRFTTDGTIRLTHDAGTTVELTNDGSVVIDNGNTQPVTDVATTTDSDGHVTGVSLTRADGVYLPSQ